MSLKSEVDRGAIGDQARRLIQGPKACAKCGYDIYVEVCHKQPVKDFPGSTPLSVINDPNNLMYLCPNHHKEFDRGFISLSDIFGNNNPGSG